MARRMTRQRSTGTLTALALIGGLALLVFSLWSAGGATAGPPPDESPGKTSAAGPRGPPSQPSRRCSGRSSTSQTAARCSRSSCKRGITACRSTR